MVQIPDRMDAPKGAEGHAGASAAGISAAVAVLVKDGSGLSERTRRQQARWIYAGVGIGVLLSYVATGVHVAFSGWGILPLQLIWYLMLFPYLGALLGYRLCPGAGEITWSWRWAGIGIVLGYVITGVHLALSGWHVLPLRLFGNLMLLPSLGALLGCRRWPVTRESTGSERRLRFSTLTLMILVAYVALLLGMVVSTKQIGINARQYYKKRVTYEDKAIVYGLQAHEADVLCAEHLASAAQLHQGRIPEALRGYQKDFLQSGKVPEVPPQYQKYVSPVSDKYRYGLEILLQGRQVALPPRDEISTPEYRDHRYALMEEGEEKLAKMQARSAEEYRKLSEYHKDLAGKYERARWRPWLSVDPDLPTPSPH